MVSRKRAKELFSIQQRGYNRYSKSWVGKRKGDYLKKQSMTTFYADPSDIYDLFIKAITGKHEK